MAIDDDLPEYIGSDHSTLAAPKGKRAAAPPVVAIYSPPAPGTTSHAKHSILGPALRLDAAEADFNAANLELNSAFNWLRACERIEADAHATFIRACPGPSAETVHRALIARETFAKLERVAKGLPPVEPKKITARSPIDLAAASRARTTPSAPNSPLRSSVSRRGNV